MSRAFVKESDDDLTAGELPERPLSARPNYGRRGGRPVGAVRELNEHHERIIRGRLGRQAETA
jgi:hypothetical protein